MVLCLVDLGYVHTKADSFCAATKIIAERACAHSQERLWWRDFCDGANCAVLISRVDGTYWIVGFVPNFGMV